MRYAVVFLLLLSIACKSPIDYIGADLKSEKGYYRAVIEIPAGTNAKVEYDKLERKFRTSLRDGKERHIDFLAYPANYGFIPSTYSNPEKGGDGDALDIMVLSSSLESGKIIEIIPIGVLKLMDAGEEDFKIIAIPAESGLRNIDVKNFREFSEKYSGAKEIIQTWFWNYDPHDPSEILGWGDEKQANELIEAAAREF